MRKLVTLVGIIVVAAIAIAWSTLDRSKPADKTQVEAAATMYPHDIMVTLGRHLPAEYWADPF